MASAELEIALSWWKVLVVLIACGFPFSASLFQWLGQKEISPVLRVRNPSAVFCTSTYACISLILEILQLLTPHGICITEYFSRGSIISFAVAPLLMRVAQYILSRNGELRRRFPRLRSHRLATRVTLCFAFCNILVYSCFFWWIIGYPVGTYDAACLMQADALYPGVFAIIVIPLVVIFTYKLKSKRDVYAVAKETRIWFCMLGIVGFPALAFASVQSTFFGVPSWRLSGILMVLFHFATLLLLLVHPLWIKRQIAMRNKELFVKERQRYLTAHFKPGELSEEDIEDLMQDPIALEFFHTFAREHFVPEIPLFLHTAHRYRAKAAAAAAALKHPRGPPASAAPLARVGAAAATDADGDLHALYLVVVADFLTPGAPYELNLDAAQFDAAQALRCPEAWAAAGRARCWGALNAPRAETLRLFQENYGLEFRAELDAFQRRAAAGHGEAAAASGGQGRGAVACGRTCDWMCCSNKSSPVAVVSAEIGTL